MSPQLTTINLLLSYLLFHTISSACIPQWTQDTLICATAYHDAINPKLVDLDTSTRIKCVDFYEYLKALENPSKIYTWYSFWEDQKDEIDIKQCEAIIPVEGEPTTTCLCQLHEICDDICDRRIQKEFVDIIPVMLDENPYAIPCGYGITKQNCTSVMNVIQITYQDLCSETDIYKLIQQCATNGPACNTPPPTTPTSPNPTTSPIISTTGSPTTTITTTSTTSIASVTSVTDTDATGISTTTDEPTPAPYNTSTFDANATTYEPSPRPTEPVNSTEYGMDTSTTDDYDGYYDDIPSSTMADLLFVSPNTHPFANLLLVSLIILGFCVFVAWYAKKNQISSDSPNNDDNGYLWGLNKSSSPNDDNITDDGDKYSSKNSKFSKGKFKHKKLSQFDDELMTEQMNIQMTINNKNNNDLLAITPDHISRLQTRVPPNGIAPNIPRKIKKPRKSKKIKGKTFSRLKDDDDVDMDDSDTDSSDTDSSGVDMMKMRDEYYASQTFSKKIADTLGDISETVKDAANVVKTKLSKREQTVVRPMQIKVKKKKNDVRKKPFTMVEDNETTDGFDLSDRNDDEESSSTKEDEYRDDSETEVRVNIHGKKIKQPMKLPTFNSNDEDDGIHMLSQSHSIKHKKKKKKDKKKKHKKKKDKNNNNDKKQEIIQENNNNNNIVDKISDKEVDKVEVNNNTHDINIQINNDDNMGFGSDELNDDNIELTNEDVTMTMNDLQMELMKHNNKKDDENNTNDNDNNNNKVDLSFMDNITSANNDNNNTVDDVVDLVNGNGVVGNGTNVIQQN